MPEARCVFHCDVVEAKRRCHCSLQLGLSMVSERLVTFGRPSTNSPDDYGFNSTFITPGSRLANRRYPSTACSRGSTWVTIFSGCSFPVFIR